MIVTMLRRSLLAAALVSLASLMLAATAQAACDGGACPLSGGSQRTQVSRGLPFPIAALAAGQGRGRSR